MLFTVSITFVVIFVLEAIIIIIGNTFTVFVFWTQRTHLKRTCLLLINLAVADILVGIAESILLGSEKFLRIKGIASDEGNVRWNKNPGPAFQLFASSVSIYFLALVSLERAFAVLCPFRHRTTKTGLYIYSVIVIWVIGLLTLGLYLVAFYYPPKVKREHVNVTVHFSLFISLCVICGSYLKIRNRMRSPAPELDVLSRQSAERNLRLSRTIFVAIAISLVFWIPAIVVYITRELCHRCFPPAMITTVNALHLANSMVNPFVYSSRMQIFKDALKRSKLSRKRRQKVDVSFRPKTRKGLNSEKAVQCPTMNPTSCTSGIEQFQELDEVKPRKQS